MFPNSAFDPKRFEGASDDELFAAFGDPAFIQQLLAGGKTVAPDPDRRVISKREYRALVGNTKRHGFGYTPKAQLDKSAGQRELLRVLARRRASASSRSTRSPRAAARAATSTTRSTAGCRAS